MTPHNIAQQYKATPIREHDAARVFPLIQATRSDVSLEAWLAFIAALNARYDRDPVSEKVGWPPCGILAIESSRGYFHGVFSYNVGCTIDHHAVLEVSNFIAVDALDRAAAVKALIAVLDDVARTLRCTAIHTQLSGDWRDGALISSQLRDHFHSAGHAPRFLNFYKPL
ncbi:MAG: hypothetical protein JKY20_01020 [Alphaproteobacteria bacterium]|nr:hypothetical protein [Alphaproteobacteria bacterium]